MAKTQKNKKDTSNNATIIAGDTFNYHKANDNGQFYLSGDTAGLTQPTTPESIEEVFSWVPRPSVKEDMSIDTIVKKLDTIIDLLSIKNENKLSEMSLTELSFLKELLNRNITVNKYPGGDINLILMSNELIVNIDNEVNNRINSYV